MQAMILRSDDEAAVLEAAEVDKPSTKAGEVLVKIAASSVNAVDTMIRRMGKDLPLPPATPAILGMDFASIVKAMEMPGGDYAVLERDSVAIHLFRDDVQDQPPVGIHIFTRDLHELRAELQNRGAHLSQGIRLAESGLACRFRGSPFAEDEELTPPERCLYMP